MHILYTGCSKIKKNTSGDKRLKYDTKWHQRAGYNVIYTHMLDTVKAQTTLLLIFDVNIVSDIMNDSRVTGLTIRQGEHAGTNANRRPQDKSRK